MDYKKPIERPQGGKFFGFDRIVFYVGNAKQAAAFYTSRFGFDYFAYKGLENGEREVACHVIKKNSVVLEFRTSYDPLDKLGVGEHVKVHGDGVKDIGFNVDDARSLYKKAVERGAKSIMAPVELKDNDGIVILATIQTYGDTTHTFVQREGYKGLFMPGYFAHKTKEVFNEIMEPVELGFIDHIVGNMPEKEMEATVQWYEKHLDFHRFWSVDDSMMHTEYSALNSIVVCDYDEKVKMPINEPAKGKKKSQIQEYVDYYHGAGAQHIAINVKDIISVITNMKKRGVEFLNVPKSYYDNLRKNIPKMSIEIKEDIDKIEELRILIDYDDKGYLLQLFTKPVEDRPTLFFEIIQRNNHQGFGAGNFKSLFEAIENEQALRGNLI